MPSEYIIYIINHDSNFQYITLFSVFVYLPEYILRSGNVNVKIGVSIKNGVRLESMASQISWANSDRAFDTMLTLSVALDIPRLSFLSVKWSST